MDFRRQLAAFLSLGFTFIHLPYAYAAVGATRGIASISQNGAAQYTIPLSLPPGTARLTPQLAISYDSTRENGILGMGFGIGGLSAITRCPKTIVQDGAASPVLRQPSDGYCLDGARLRLQSGSYGQAGSVYRTEVDRFAKIVALGANAGGPTTFEVWMHNGLIYRYGGSDTARVEYVGSSSVRVWALSSIEDRAGNIIAFTYNEDPTGGYRPDEVTYTVNHNAGIVAAPYRIKFLYESVSRPDPIYAYDGGGAAHEFKRLERIEVRYQGTAIRQYLFSYYGSLGVTGRSRLESIQECAASTNDCFPASVFTWTTGTDTLLAAQTPGQTLPNPTMLHLMDIDGDGRDDLVYSSSATSGAGTWRIRRANASGGYSAETNTGVANTNYAQALSLEWDGDGRMDLLVPYTGGRWHVLRANGTGFDSPFDTGIDATGAADYVRAFDINGDGRDDLVRLTSSGMAKVFVRYRGATNFGAETTLWQSGNNNVTFDLGFLSRPHYFKYRSHIRRADFEGDGREDFIAILRESDPESGSSTRYYGVFTAGVYKGQLEFSSDLGGNHLWADINGDGKTDIVWVSVSGQVRFAFGTGLTTTAIGTGQSSTSFNASWMVVADYNGDGRDDVLMPMTPNAAINWMRSTGSGLANGLSTDATWAGQGLMTGDLDGNGYADLMFAGSSLSYRRHAGGAADYLDTATDGFGVRADFDYARLSDGPPLYTKGTSSQHPVSDYAGSMLVASQLKQSDGKGGTYTLEVQYEAARQHATGRGFLGFAKRRITDTRNNVTIEETYQQNPNEYQVLGALSSVVIRQNSGSPISETSITWNRAVYGSGTSERRFPYPEQVVRKRYEVGGAFNGALLTTATTVNKLDSTSGVIFDSTTTITEAIGANGNYGGRKQVRRTYHSDRLNDEANWCIGRPRTTLLSASHEQPGGADLLRTTQTVWDGTHCRPDSVTVEPGNVDWQIATSYEYDEFGNVDLVTMTPAANRGQAVRITDIEWDDTGRFPESVTNPEQEVTIFEWDFAKGLRTAVTDPNGIRMGWQFDTFGRLKREDHPDGTATRYTLNPCNIPNSYCGSSDLRAYVEIAQLDTTGAVFRTDTQYFDAFDRIRYDYRQMIGGGQSGTEFTYDAFGRLRSQSMPFTSGDPRWYTTYSYDVIGRPTLIERQTSEIDPSASFVEFTYDGLRTRVSDPLQRSSTYVYDSAGRIVQAFDAAQSDTDYEYDAFGNLRTVRDFYSKEILISYNVRGLKESMTDPTMGTWTYEYYPFGELKKQTNAASQSIQFVYDRLSRPVSRIDHAEGTTTYVWDSVANGIGRLGSVQGPGHREDYGYDSAGRISSYVTTIDGTSHTYTYGYHPTQGLLQTVTYPVSNSSARFKVRYGWQYGVLQSVRDYTSDVLGTIYWQANATNARGQIIDEQFGNGLRTISTYDRIAGWLDDRTTGLNGGSEIQNLLYTWHKSGKLFERQDRNQDLTETFYYDALDRLDYSTLNGLVNLDLSYDAAGRIESKAMTGANPTSTAEMTWYTYGLPRTLETAEGSSEFFYGVNRERIKQISGSGSSTETITYIGDLLEKRVSGATTEHRHYVYGAAGPVAIVKRNNSGASSTYYIATDHLGSTESITNSVGSLLVRTSFGAFGERRGGNWMGTPSSSELAQIAATTRRGFTFHEHLDNVGLIHMNGRVYDPGVGRFTSADPFVQAPFFSQSLYRYAYTFNSPLSYTDPSGFKNDNIFDSYCDDQDSPSCLDEVIVDGKADPLPSFFWTAPLPGGFLFRDSSDAEEIIVSASRIGESSIIPLVNHQSTEDRTQSQQPELSCSALWGAVQDATGGPSHQDWYDDVVDNFVNTTDTGASALLSTGLSMAGASTTAKSWGGITMMQLGQQAWNSRYGAIRTPGLIGARSVPSAFVTAGASWAVNAVLIKGAYNSGVLAGSLIRTGVNRAAASMCAPE